VAYRVDFDVATAKDFSGTKYDLVMSFNCLHDMAIRSAAPRTCARRSPRDGA
jgi:hypothetical protein